MNRAQKQAAEAEARRTVREDTARLVALNRLFDAAMFRMERRLRTEREQAARFYQELHP